MNMSGAYQNPIYNQQMQQYGQQVVIPCYHLVWYNSMLTARH